MLLHFRCPVCTSKMWRPRSASRRCHSIKGISCSCDRCCDGNPLATNRTCFLGSFMKWPQTGAGFNSKLEERLVVTSILKGLLGTICHEGHLRHLQIFKLEVWMIWTAVGVQKKSFVDLTLLQHWVEGWARSYSKRCLGELSTFQVSMWKLNQGWQVHRIVQY